MSMNLAMSLNGVYLNTLYQTPTETTWLCYLDNKWIQPTPGHPGHKVATRRPQDTSIRTYNKYANWCWKSLVPIWVNGAKDMHPDTEDELFISRQWQIREIKRNMNRHLKEVKRLLDAGATFVVS